MILQFNYEFARSLNNEASTCTEVGSVRKGVPDLLAGGSLLLRPHAMLDAMYAYA